MSSPTTRSAAFWRRKNGVENWDTHSPLSFGTSAKNLPGPRSSVSEKYAVINSSPCTRRVSAHVRRTATGTRQSPRTATVRRERCQPRSAGPHSSANTATAKPTDNSHATTAGHPCRSTRTAAVANVQPASAEATRRRRRQMTRRLAVEPARDGLSFRSDCIGPHATLNFRKKSPRELLS